MKNEDLEKIQATERLAGHLDAVANGKVTGLSVYLDGETVAAVMAKREQNAAAYKAAGVEAPTVGAMVRRLVSDALNKDAK